MDPAVVGAFQAMPGAPLRLAVMEWSGAGFQRVVLPWQEVQGRSDLATYSPFGKDFYLFNTCRGTSILSYGAFGLKARWLRRLKDPLDRALLRPLIPGP
jgi:hypothetical protein